MRWTLRVAICFVVVAALPEGARSARVSIDAETVGSCSASASISENGTPVDSVVVDNQLCIADGPVAGADVQGSLCPANSVSSAGGAVRNPPTGIRPGGLQATFAALVSVDADDVDPQTCATVAGDGTASASVSWRVNNPSSRARLFQLSSSSCLDAGGENLELTIGANGPVSACPPQSAFFVLGHDDELAAMGSASAASSNAFLASGGSVELELEPGLVVAALGDSYGAGVGAGSYEATAGACFRSANAYQALLDLEGPLAPHPFLPTHPGIAITPELTNAELDVFSVACSGAVTANITAEDSLDQPNPQLFAEDGNGNALIDENTDLVTILIGGNDAGFAQTVALCAGADCSDPSSLDVLFYWPQQGTLFLSDLVAQRVADLRIDAELVLSEVKSRAPNASVYLLGYPRIYGDTVLASGWCALDWVGIKPEEVQVLEGFTVQLNQALREAALSVGVHYVDVLEDFRGQEACSADPWIYGGGRGWPEVDIPGTGTVEVPELYHPNAQGQAAYARAVREYIGGEVATFFPFGPVVPLPSGLPPNPAPAPAPPPPAIPAGASQATPLSLSRLSDIEVASRSELGCSGRAIWSPGETVGFSSEGFDPFEAVDVSLVLAGQSIPLPSLSADSTGAISSSLVLPGGASEGHALVALLGTVSRIGAFGSFVVSPDASTDRDGDGVIDICDNCRELANGSQADDDGDGTGNACDVCPADFGNDGDLDGLCVSVDACPLDSYNDVDGDGLCGNVDNCPLDPNPDQTDTDGDGRGDVCEAAQCFQVSVSATLDGAPSPSAGIVNFSTSTCGTAGSYQAGTAVIAAAVPAFAYTFEGFSSPVATSAPTLTFVPVANTVVTADFAVGTPPVAVPTVGAFGRGMAMLASVLVAWWWLRRAQR